MRSAALATLLAVCACNQGTAAKEPTPAAATSDAGGLPLVFMGDIEVRAKAAGVISSRIGTSAPLEMTLISSHGATWSEIAKRTGSKASPDGSFSFVHAGYPASPDPVLPIHRSATFVIDFDEPSVRDVAALVPRGSTMDALSRFTNTFITDKNMQRTFDVASRVASHKEGDCSEHAVLLAALGRSFGWATRVVLGAVVLAFEGGLFAFAHAWVEWRDDGAWRVADAALPAELAARYVPLAVLDDEGPAFMRKMTEVVDVALLRAIELK